MWCLPRFLPRKPGVDERKPGVGGQAPRIRIQRSLKVHQTEYRDTPPALSPVSRRDYRRYVYRTLRQRTSTAGLQMWVTCNAYERRAATGYSNLQYPPASFLCPKQSVQTMSCIMAPVRGWRNAATCMRSDADIRSVPLNAPKR